MLEYLLLGHVLGDYYAQFHEMAQAKSKPGIDGRNACIVHSFTYTLWVYAIMSCVGFASLWYFPLVFLSHYPIDRIGLAAKIIAWKGGPEPSNPWYPSIYIIIDNSMHLILMWFIYTRF